MKSAKRKQLEKLGWTVGDTAEFLQLSPKEAALVETRLGRANQSKPQKK